MRATVKWILLGLLIIAPIGGGLFMIKMSQFSAMGEASAGMVAPPTPVNSWTVRQATWVEQLHAVGSVRAIQGAMVSTESDGIVREISFEPGSSVPAGAVLLKLDQDSEMAQLREANAAAELAELTAQRARNLARSRNISQGDVDSAESALQRARAQVDYIRSLIGRKTVRAPFAGELGIRQVSVGQYLAKGAPVVSLQSLDPVFVEFSLPQRHLADLADGLELAVSADAWPGQRFEGAVSALNPQINPATRNVQVQATLSNPERKLRPGMFVSVTIRLASSREVLPVPSTALIHGPSGDTVFVIGETQNAAGGTALSVDEKRVRTGGRRGDFVDIVAGLADGDRVVSTGPFKLRSGMPVVIDNSLAPDFQLQPRPDNT